MTLQQLELADRNNKYPCLNEDKIGKRCTGNVRFKIFGTYGNMFASGVLTDILSIENTPQKNNIFQLPHKLMSNHKRPDTGYLLTIMCDSSNCLSKEQMSDNVAFFVYLLQETGTKHICFGARSPVENKISVESHNFDDLFNHFDNRTQKMNPIDKEIITNLMNEQLSNLNQYSDKIMLLVCAREYLSGNLFHTNELPLDMFRLIIKTTTNNL